MTWQCRFDITAGYEVLELVLSEEEAETVSRLLAITLPPKPPLREGLAGIVGKWPGDETDEDIAEALEVP